MADDIVTRLRSDAELVKKIYGITWPMVNDAADEIERLRAERDEANANAKLYRDERDEARREVCAFSYDGPRRTAEDRGWDCFKEPEDHAP